MGSRCSNDYGPRDCYLDNRCSKAYSYFKKFVGCDERDPLGGFDVVKDEVATASAG